MGKVVLYKSGGWDKVHGVECTSIIIDEHEVEDYLADGWCDSPQGAAIAKDKDKSKVNPQIDRTTIEAKAKELDVTYPANISDVKLIEKIKLKIAGQ